MPFLRPPFLARALCALLLAAPLAAAMPILSHRERDGWVEAGETPGCVNWIVEAPSGALYGYSGQPGDLHRSEDGGETWTAIPAPPGYISSILVNPLDSRTVYAIAQGLYISRDAGLTWGRNISAPPYVGGSLTVDPFLPRTLYATAGCCYPSNQNPEVWMSADEGERWVERSAGLSSGGPGQIISILADPRADGVLLASLSTGVYRTVDRGVHWSRISDSEVGRLRGFDAATSEVVWSNGQSPMRSADGGVTWTSIESVNPYPGVIDTSVVDLVSDPARAHAAYASVDSEFASLFFTHGVQMTTDDGASWRPMSGDIDATADSWARPLAVGADGRRLWTTTCGLPNAIYRLDFRRPTELAPR